MPILSPCYPQSIPFMIGYVPLRPEKNHPGTIDMHHGGIFHTSGDDP